MNEIHPKNTSSHPDAALATLLSESNKNAPISHRIPRIKTTAYILIGLVLFSAIQSLLMSSVVLSLGNLHDKNPFLSFTIILGWILAISAGIILLTTKRTGLAKKVVLALGVAIAYYAITELNYFNIIGLGIDLFVLWWLYDIYQSLEAVEHP